MIFIPDPGVKKRQRFPDPEFANTACDTVPLTKLLLVEMNNQMEVNEESEEEEEDEEGEEGGDWDDDSQEEEEGGHNLSGGLSPSFNLCSFLCSL